MSARFGSNLAHPFVLFLCLLFIAAGWVFIRRAGVHEDEALFAAGLFQPRDLAGEAIGVPLMLNSYLGCLKTWIYAGIFRVWEVSVYSIRVPALIAGALAIWLWFRLLSGAAGTRAALFTAALLATDTTWVLTSCLDWGPVALQHLLTAAAALLWFRFHRTGARWRLALAAFLCGLALWDKAAALWVFAGAAAGLLAVFPRETARRLTARDAALAAGFLLLGASPLVYYNLVSGGGTLRAGAISSEPAGGKGAVLLSTVNGSGLFAFLTRPGADRVRGPETRVERVSLALNETAGSPRGNALPLAVAAAALALPFLRRTPAARPMLFALVAFAAGWLAMLITSHGGAGAHHIVLLWPLPHAFAGLALAELSRARISKAATAAVLIAGLLCAANLALTNAYLAEVIEAGPSPLWSDAIFPLAGSLAAERIYAADWGIEGRLRLLGAGRLPVALSSDLWHTDWIERNPAAARHLLGFPGHWFVSYLEGQENFPGVRARLRRIAGPAGLREHRVHLVPDRHGRPVFEIFRFLPANSVQ